MPLLTARLRGINRSICQHLASAGLVVGSLVVVLASFGCASTRPLGSETIVTDSATYRLYQRLVAVAVPGDSARLRSRLVYDETTHQFRPVTIFSQAGHTRLAVQLDAFGVLTATAVVPPYVARVVVTDTSRTRTRTTATTQTVAVEAPKSRFVKFCIWFTCLALAAGALWAYSQLTNPFRF